MFSSSNSTSESYEYHIERKDPTDFFMEFGIGTFTHEKVRVNWRLIKDLDEALCQGSTTYDPKLYLLRKKGKRKTNKDIRSQDAQRFLREKIYGSGNTHSPLLVTIIREDTSRIVLGGLYYTSSKNSNSPKARIYVNNVWLEQEPDIIRYIISILRARIPRDILANSNLHN